MLLLARHLLYYCASATAFFFLPFSLSFFHHAFFFLPFSLSFFHHVFQMGHLRPLFVYVSSFQAFYTIKIFNLSVIRTQIVGVEAEYADHLTTTMAHLPVLLLTVLCSFSLSLFLLLSEVDKFRVKF